MAGPDRVSACFDDFPILSPAERVHNSAARHVNYRLDFEPQLLAVEGEHGMRPFVMMPINSRFLNTHSLPMHHERFKRALMTHAAPIWLVKEFFESFNTPF